MGDTKMVKFIRPNKKVSASTNMAQIFTGGWSVFFFCWDFLHANPVYANLYFSRAGNSHSGSLAARRTPLPKSPRPRVCWTVGHVRVTSSSRASSARAPLDSFRRWCEKRHGAGLLLLCQVSGVKMRRVEFKDWSSPSATRNTESNVASSSTCRRRLLQTGFMSVGKLTDTVDCIELWMRGSGSVQKCGFSHVPALSACTCITRVYYQ